MAQILGSCAASASANGEVCLDSPGGMVGGSGWAIIPALLLQSLLLEIICGQSFAILKS